MTFSTDEQGSHAGFAVAYRIVSEVLVCSYDTDSTPIAWPLPLRCCVPTRSFRRRGACRGPHLYSQPVVGTKVQLVAGVTVLPAIHWRYCLYVGPMPPGVKLVVFASN